MAVNRPITEFGGMEGFFLLAVIFYDLFGNVLFWHVTIFLALLARSFEELVSVDVSHSLAIVLCADYYLRTISNEMAANLGINASIRVTSGQAVLCCSVVWIKTNRRVLAVNDGGWRDCV